MNIPWWTGVKVIHSMCVYVWEGGGLGEVWELLQEAMQAEGQETRVWLQD